MEDSGERDHLASGAESETENRKSDHEVLDNDGAEIPTTEKSSSNPNKIGWRHG